MQLTSPKMIKNSLVFFNNTRSYFFKLSNRIHSSLHDVSLAVSKFQRNTVKNHFIQASSFESYLTAGRNQISSKRRVISILICIYMLSAAFFNALIVYYDDPKVTIQF